MASDNLSNGSLDVDQAAVRIGSLIGKTTADNGEPEEQQAGNADLEGDETEAEDPDEEEGEPETDDEETEEEETAEAEPTFTVKVDGKEFQVTEKELLDGYQRQADYTRKAQAVAEERKANEAESTAVRAERQTLAHWAQQMLMKLQRDAPQEPNWEELRVADPIGFAAQWAEHQRYREQQQQIAAQYNAVLQKNQADEAAALKKTLASETELLGAAIPEWKDEKRASKEKSDMLAYGRKVGFSDDELNTVYDHRAVIVLRKAMLYDRMQQSRPQVQAARQSAPPVSPPAGKTVSRRVAVHQKAMQRLAKTGSVSDAAAAMEGLL